MTHEIDYTDFIERYLENSMSHEERVWFEKEMEGNPSLQQAVDFNRNIQTVLEDKESIELMAQLEQIHNDIEEKEEHGNSILNKVYTNIMVAVGATILIVLSFVFYNSTKDFSSEKLIGMYYQPEAANGSYRTVAKADVKLDEAILLYESQNYRQAIELFETVLKNNPDMIGLNLYSGISHMEIQEYTTANEQFKSILEKDPNPFVESATWYLGLCYLYTEERDKAKDAFTTLVNNEGYYANDAKKILKRL